MRKIGLVVATSFIVVCSLVGVSAAQHAEDLPAGPIRDRHQLMEGVGKTAKVINDAMKSGDFAPVAGAAEQIQTAATKVAALFPPGSTHEKSRAKPEIWTSWPKFEAGTKQLESAAGALAAAAKGGSGVPAATQKLFDSCKSCHDQFRVPDKKK